MRTNIARTGGSSEADWLFVAQPKHRYTSLVTNLKRSEGIKLNENKTEWRHQSGTKGPFNAALTVLINEMNDKVASKC